MKNKIILLFLFSFKLNLFSQELFISPKGNDKNPGTIDQPFATLEKARNEIRKMKKKSGLHNFTVWLRGGVYSRENSFELKNEDSGEINSPVTYKAYNNEEVRIIGGKKIDPKNFSEVKDPFILKRLNQSVRDKILQLDLKSLKIINYGSHKQIGHGLPVVPTPLELFIDHKPLQLSKYPNQGAISIGKVHDTGSLPRNGDTIDIRGGLFEYTDNRHNRWLLNDDIWFQGTFMYGFSDDKIKVKNIDTAKRLVRLASPHSYGIGSGEPFNQYIAYNILEEIDMPGEYYLDRNSGMLYLYPEREISNSDIEVSIIEEPLFVLDNVSYINIINITLETTRGTGIYIEGGENNKIIGCTIRNIGTLGIQFGKGAKRLTPIEYGIYYKGEPSSREVGVLISHRYFNTEWDRNAGKNHTILSCDIYNTGSGGIMLGGGSKKDLISGNNQVINCKIHDFQLKNKATWTGINVDGCGNIIRNNEIYNADLQAILAMGNEHIFEYNHIHHVAMNCNDGSAWYLGRDPSDRGNTVRYNFFHHIGRTDRKWIMGVYFDDASCDGLVEGNVFYKVGTYGTVYSNSGQDLTIRNNIFIDCLGPVVFIKSMWWDFAIDQWDIFFGPNGIYRKRLAKAIDIKKPPYSIKYPNLKNWLDLTDDGKTYYGMYPKRNIVENNLIYKFDETFRLVGLNIECEIKNNYITTKDPGFIDFEKNEFSII